MKLTESTPSVRALRGHPLHWRFIVGKQHSVANFLGYQIAKNY